MSTLDTINTEALTDQTELLEAIADSAQRIHYWVRLWSVLSIVGIVLFLIVQPLAAQQTERKFASVSYCLSNPTSVLCD